MSDTLHSKDETEPDAPLAGKRLAEARTAQNISVFDIAKELHLDEPKVSALEDNQFDVLGAPVFAKGHLRKYAELVGVPTDDVMADYYMLNRAVGAPPVVGRPHKPEPTYNLGRWVVTVVIVALLGAAAVGGYWRWQQREAEPVSQIEAGGLAPFVSSPENDIEIPSSTDSTNLLAEQVDAGDAQASDEEVAIALAAPVVTNDAPSPAPVRPTSGLPQATLTLNFSGDCWTEVSNASGERLYFDLGRAGRTVSVTGDAPLRALFGDSANVSIEINGQAYVIPDSMRSGRTARLTVNAP